MTVICTGVWALKNPTKGEHRGTKKRRTQFTQVNNVFPYFFKQHNEELKDRWYPELSYIVLCVQNRHHLVQPIEIQSIYRTLEVDPEEGKTNNPYKVWSNLL